MKALKAVGRWIVAVFAFIGAVCGVAAVVKGLRAVLGEVRGKGDAWIHVPGSPREIDVYLPGAEEPSRVSLPDEVEANDIQAVQVVPGGDVVVAVKHKPRDRHVGRDLP